MASPKLLKALEIQFNLTIDRALRLSISSLRLSESRSTHKQGFWALLFSLKLSSHVQLSDRAFGLYYLHFQLQKEMPLPFLGLDLL